MNRNYLLTYVKNDDGYQYHTFDWFESEDEMKQFIKDSADEIVEICEAQEILGAKNIEVESK